MQKVVVSLFRTFFLWIFFMLYKGLGGEDFNVIKMFSMFLLAVGIVWYIKLDMDY